MAAPSPLLAGLDEEDAHFYEVVRQYIIILVCFCTSFTYSFVKVDRRLNVGKLESDPSTRQADAIGGGGRVAARRSGGRTATSARKPVRGLAFFLCVFVFTVAYLWPLILVLTLAVSEENLKLHWLLSRWLTRDLVNTLWLAVTWSSSAALLLLVPFAYLYHEAEGVMGMRGWAGRLAETLVVLLLLSGLTAGVFVVLSTIWTGSTTLEPFSSSSVTNIGQYLPGLALYLAFCHRGISEIAKRAFRQWVPFGYVDSLKQAVDRYDLQLMHLTGLLRDYTSAAGLEPDGSNATNGSGTTVGPYSHTNGVVAMQDCTAASGLGTAHGSRSAAQTRSGNVVAARSVLVSRVDMRWDVLQRDKLVPLTLHASSAARLQQEKLPRAVVEAEANRTREALRTVARKQRSANRELRAWCCCVRLASPWVRNPLCVLYTIVSLLLAWHLVLRSVARELSLVSALLANSRWMSYVPSFGRLVRAPRSWSKHPALIVLALLLGVPPTSRQSLPLLDFLLNLVLVAYFGVATNIGLRHSRFMAPFGAERGKMQHLLGQAALLLIQTSGLPLCVWVLGVAPFPLMDYYPHAKLVRGGLMLHACNLLFLGLSGWYFAAFWLRYLHKYYIQLRRWVWTSRNPVARYVARPACTLGCAVRDYIMGKIYRLWGRLARACWQPLSQRVLKLWRDFYDIL